MTAKTEYAVLRFVPQDHYCHMVHDYVQGHSIMEYVKESVVFDKKKTFALAQDLAKQLEQFYKCEDEAYGYVNPYAIVITEENSIVLLDIWAEENKALLEKMQKKKVRVLFISPEYVLSQRKRREDDLYGFGKTVQFLLEKCCGKNVFTFREEKMIKKLYEKCERKEKVDIGTWKSLQKSLGKLSNTNNKKKGYLRYISIILVFTGSVLMSIMGGYWFAKETLIKEKKEEMRITSEMEQEWRQENAKTSLELGLLYLANDDTDEMGYLYLQNAAEELEFAEKYVTIFEYLQKDTLEDEEKVKLRTALEDGRQDVKKYSSEQYKIPFLRAYMMLNEESDWNEVIALTESMEKSETVRGYIALAYEKQGKYEAAIVEYEELKKMETTGSNLRWIYEKLMELYHAVDLPDKLKENYEEAVSLIPKLGNDEDFLKLKEKYGIEMETAPSTEEIVAEQ